MAKINVLSKEVYNQISAGEVVERPASIVKELFENSIDAGAKNIIVCIENGGINSISVQDDGSGIEKDELSKVFLPHATSKISKASDLDSILTLGFRGEAMSSISAVSKVKLLSKTADEEIGSYLSVYGGKIEDEGEEQCETGTKITVTGIFYNTPARLKFLKTPKSEEGEVTTLMEKLILANPNVAVKYFVNSKLVFQSFGDGLESAVTAIYPNNTINNCREVSTVKNGIKIEGFLGNINFVKSNKTYQTLIVNGRWVTDTTISSAISNAYSSYLMKRQYPFYVLSITVPPEIVDVNVHPRKSEVRFQNNQIIYGSVYSVVSKVVDGTSQALEIVKSIEEKTNEAYKESQEILSSVNETASIDSAPSLNDNGYSLSNENFSVFSKNKTFIDKNGKVQFNPYDKTVYSKPVTSSVRDHYSQIDADFSETATEDPDDIFKENKKYIAEREFQKAKQQTIVTEEKLELVGQVFDTFLIFESGNELYFVDQHAAHERILYDRLLNKIQSQTLIRQQLLIPYCITVNAKEFDLLYELMDYIRALGIDIELYGENSFRIYSVPQDFEDINIEKFIADIINDAKFRTEKIPSVIKETLMQKACKSAIKAGDKLSLSEIDALMEQLKNNFGLKCPHGRPIAIKISRTEIDKWFKRIV